MQNYVKTTVSGICNLYIWPRPIFHACGKGKESVLSAGGEGNRVFWGGGCSIPRGTTSAVNRPANSEEIPEVNRDL